MGSGTGVSPDHRATESQIEDEMLALVTQLTNEINWYMRERGLTRADLAARMGVSPGRVSQILGGDTFTSDGTTRTESAPAGNRHTLSRTTHREARLGR